MSQVTPNPHRSSSAAAGSISGSGGGSGSGSGSSGSAGATSPSHGSSSIAGHGPRRSLHSTGTAPLHLTDSYKNNTNSGGGNSNNSGAGAGAGVSAGAFAAVRSRRGSGNTDDYPNSGNNNNGGSNAGESSSSQSPRSPAPPGISGGGGGSNAAGTGLARSRRTTSTTRLTSSLSRDYSAGGNTTATSNSGASVGGSVASTAYGPPPSASSSLPTTTGDDSVALGEQDDTVSMLGFGGSAAGDDDDDRMSITGYLDLAASPPGFEKMLHSDVSDTEALEMLLELQAEGTPLLSTFSHSDLSLLASVLSVMYLEDQETVITKGENATFAAIVLSGSLQIIVDDNLKFDVLKGETLGEMAFFESGKRSATVVSAGTAALGTIRFVELERLLYVHPQLQAKLTHMLAMASLSKLRLTIARLQDFKQASDSLNAALQEQVRALGGVPVTAASLGAGKAAAPAAAASGTAPGTVTATAAPTPAPNSSAESKAAESGGDINNSKDGSNDTNAAGTNEQQPDMARSASFNRSTTPPEDGNGNGSNSSGDGNGGAAPRSPELSSLPGPTVSVVAGTVAADSGASAAAAAAAEAAAGGDSAAAAAGKDGKDSEGKANAGSSAAATAAGANAANNAAGTGANANANAATAAAAAAAAAGAGAGAGSVRRLAPSAKTAKDEETAAGGSSNSVTGAKPLSVVVPAAGSGSASSGGSGSTTNAGGPRQSFNAGTGASTGAGSGAAPGLGRRSSSADVSGGGSGSAAAAEAEPQATESLYARRLQQQRGRQRSSLASPSSGGGAAGAAGGAGVITPSSVAAAGGDVSGMNQVVVDRRTVSVPNLTAAKKVIVALQTKMSELARRAHELSRADVDHRAAARKNREALKNEKESNAELQKTIDQLKNALEKHKTSSGDSEKISKESTAAVEEITRELGAQVAAAERALAAKETELINLDNKYKDLTAASKTVFNRMYLKLLYNAAAHKRYAGELVKSKRRQEAAEVQLGRTDDTIIVLESDRTKAQQEADAVRASLRLSEQRIRSLATATLHSKVVMRKQRLALIALPLIMHVKFFRLRKALCGVAENVKLILCRLWEDLAQHVQDPSVYIVGGDSFLLRSPTDTLDMRREVKERVRQLRSERRVMASVETLQSDVARVSQLCAAQLDASQRRVREVQERADSSLAQQARARALEEENTKLVARVDSLERGIADREEAAQRRSLAEQADRAAKTQRAAALSRSARATARQVAALQGEKSALEERLKRFAIAARLFTGQCEWNLQQQKLFTLRAELKHKAHVAKLQGDKQLHRAVMAELEALPHASPPLPLTVPVAPVIAVSSSSSSSGRNNGNGGNNNSGDTTLPARGAGAGGDEGDDDQTIVRGSNAHNSGEDTLYGDDADNDGTVGADNAAASGDGAAEYDDTFEDDNNNNDASKSTAASKPSMNANSARNSSNANNKSSRSSSRSDNNINSGNSGNVRTGTGSDDDAYLRWLAHVAGATNPASNGSGYVSGNPSPTPYSGSNNTTSANRNGSSNGNGSGRNANGEFLPEPASYYAGLVGGAPAAAVAGPHDGAVHGVAQHQHQQHQCQQAEQRTLLAIAAQQQQQQQQRRQQSQRGDRDRDREQLYSDIHPTGGAGGAAGPNYRFTVSSFARPGAGGNSAANSGMTGSLNSSGAAGGGGGVTPRPSSLRIGINNLDGAGSGSGSGNGNGGGGQSSPNRRRKDAASYTAGSPYSVAPYSARVPGAAAGAAAATGAGGAGAPQSARSSHGSGSGNSGGSGSGGYDLPRLTSGGGSARR